jgi:glycine/D-amino acid oxidase-like deaminating enzyme
MAPIPDAIVPNETLPARAEVVVIGGGIIGTSTAYFLARRGVPVALCEKGRIAAEQSSRNWGWCRMQGRDPREMPLIIESLRLWRKLNEMLNEETGFRQCGIMYLCAGDAEIAYYQKWLDHARAYQVNSRVIDGDEVDRLLPGGTRRWPGALYTASDGRAEPQKAAPAIARAAQRLGASVLTGCAARGIETAAGRVSAVVTEKGRIACNSVVLAGGAWSSLFCRNLDLRLPQLKVKSTVMRTGRLAGPPERSASGPNFAFRKRLDGGYTIAYGTTRLAEIVPDSFRYFFDFLPALRADWSNIRLRLGRRTWDECRLPQRWSLDSKTPFERIRVLDPAPVEADMDKAAAALKRAFPAFEGMTIAERWAGLIDVTPDVVPVISPVERLPGFFISTGFSGHGFGIGPGAGHLMADLVTGSAPLVDPSPFRYSRFVDGSRPLLDRDLLATPVAERAR